MALTLFDDEVKPRGMTWRQHYAYIMMVTILTFPDLDLTDMEQRLDSLKAEMERDSEPLPVIPDLNDPNGPSERQRRALWAKLEIDELEIKLSHLQTELADLEFWMREDGEALPDYPPSRLLHEPPF